MMIQGVVSVLLLSMTALSASEEVKQEVAVYGWLPSLDGTMTFNVPGEPDESTEASVIDSLDAVFMGSYVISQGKYSFLADMIYLKMSGDAEGLNTDVNLDVELTAKLFSFYGGYNLLKSDKMDVDFIAGMRYFGLGLDVKRSGGLIANGTLSPSVDNYDAVVGLKWRYIIDENWYMPYQFDVGAGDSDLTWQASVSVGYTFDWGDIIATYRYMNYKGDSLLVDNFELYGPKLGVVFHF